MSKNQKTIKINDREVPVIFAKHHWSKRLTLSVRPDGIVRVTMPWHTSLRVAEIFLASSTGWLSQNLPERLVTRSSATPAQKKQARAFVRAKLDQWDGFFDKPWRQFRIANQSSRWGSCSSRGTLSFNWRILELPEDLADYLIVHELAHLVHPNHSPAFWAAVETVIPKYKDCRKRLKAFALHD